MRFEIRYFFIEVWLSYTLIDMTVLKSLTVISKLVYVADSMYLS